MKKILHRVLGIVLCRTERVIFKKWREFSVGKKCLFGMSWSNNWEKNLLCSKDPIKAKKVGLEKVCAKLPSPTSLALIGS